MPLPDVAALKRHLRIEHAAEDDYLGELLASATAGVEAYLRVPLVAGERTFYDVQRAPTYGGHPPVLWLPLAPVAETALAVVDTDGVTVDAAGYRLDRRLGTLTAIGDESFSTGPFAITATVGLSAHPDYATRIEPVLAAAIRDWVAEHWHNRNPTAQAEGAGGGVYTQRTALAALPARIQGTLAPFRRHLVG